MNPESILKHNKARFATFGLLAAHLQFVLTDDSELFCPLAETFLPQKEGTNMAVSHRGH